MFYKTTSGAHPPMYVTRGYRLEKSERRKLDVWKLNNMIIQMQMRAKTKVARKRLCFYVSIFYPVRRKDILFEYELIFLCFKTRYANLKSSLTLYGYYGSVFIWRVNVWAWEQGEVTRTAARARVVTWLLHSFGTSM